MLFRSSCRQRLPSQWFRGKARDYALYTFRQTGADFSPNTVAGACGVWRVPEQGATMGRIPMGQVACDDFFLTLFAV